MMYLGKPVVTIFLQEKTKPVNNLFKQIAYQEEKVKRQQAESFTSLVSHEMRTPLNNTIFFLNLILTNVQKYPNLASEFVK